MSITPQGIAAHPHRSQSDSYPHEWEADVVLRDGSTTHIRPIRPDDAPALQRFHMGQSQQSTYFRFFAPMERLSEADLHRFTHVDHFDRVALVAVRQAVDPEHAEDIIGVARFDRCDVDEAEVAFNIADAEQGRGLGSVLLEHVAAAARERDIHRFTAEVLPHNAKMLTVFREAGYELSQHMDDGVVTVSIRLTPTERSRQVMADREYRAESRSMAALLTAQSLVIIGPGEHGSEHHHLLAEHVARGTAQMGLDSVVYAYQVRSVPPQITVCHDLTSIPQPVDLAVVAQDSAEVIALIPQVARCGIKGVIVLSGGYAEEGPTGLARQRELLRVAHLNGVRIIGPASYGLVTGSGSSRFVACVSESVPPPGVVGLFCQSAPVAVSLLATAAGRGLGVSTFLSAGHRADVSGRDMLQFWYADDATSVACLSLESVGNPRKFSRIARRVAAIKPVVIVNAGHGISQVPPGHAVRVSQAPDSTFRDVLRQSGCIQAENSHQMIDIAQLVAHQPLPEGSRLGVVASSATLATLVTNSAQALGMSVTVTAVAEEYAGPEAVHAAVEQVYAPEACDVVIAVDVPVIADPALAPVVAQYAARTTRVTVATVVGLRGVSAMLTAADARGTHQTVPAYATPHDALVALSAVTKYAAWRRGDHGVGVYPEGIDRAAARELVSQALDAGEDIVHLSGTQSAQLLACYGMTVWPSIRVESADEAVQAAEQLGWPVALKSSAIALRDRADLGAVRLDIAHEAQLREDVVGMAATLADVIPSVADEPLEVQAMAPPGVSCVIRTTEDPLFGPIVSFGLSGDATELLGDLATGVPPLTDADIAGMVRGIKAAPRLYGYRGTPLTDVAAIRDLIARAAAMADDFPEVRSCELRPVLVGSAGAAVLGATVTLAPAAMRADALRRSLG